MVLMIVFIGGRARSFKKFVCPRICVFNDESLCLFGTGQSSFNVGYHP